ncbi:hypothetical protein Tco_1182617 [Tanacetum coccineum]
MSWSNETRFGAARGLVTFDLLGEREGYQAVLTQMAHLVANITFASTSIGSTSFLPSVLLLTIVVAIVGVAVVVVVAGAVVESSFVVA